MTRRAARGLLALAVVASAACSGGPGSKERADAASGPAAASQPATADSAPAAGAAPPDPSGPLPDSRDAERLEPAVRNRIAAAIAVARPLLDGRPLAAEELETATQACVLEQAHQLHADAADCYARAERAAPADPRWPYLLAHAELGLGERERAIAAFRRALAKKPGDAPTLAWLGQVLYETQQFAEARTCLLEALAADPDNAFAMFRLAQLETQAGEPAAAIPRLERVLQLQPGASAAHHALAQALRAAGRDAEADEHARQAGQARPGMNDPWLSAVKASASGERVHVDRGGRSFKRGDLATAEKEFRLAIEADPRSLDAWLNLSAVLQRRGDLPGAREAASTALALAPEDPDAHFNLGVIAAAQGKDAEALSHYHDALVLDPAHRGASFNAASAQLRAGQPEQAARRFESVLARDPSDTEARLGHAACLVQLGRDADAKAELERALADAPGQARLALALARLLATARSASVRDGNRALALAQQALQAERTLEATEVMAMACAEIGERELAVQWQQAAIDAVKKAGRQDLLAALEQRLALYQSGQKLRLP